MEKISIKYSKTDDLLIKECTKIEKVRARLFSLGLLNNTQDSSYQGTLSLRYKKKNSFIITGKNTSEFPKLSASYYSFVKKVDFKSQTIFAIGPRKPSLDSLIHSSLYELEEEIKTVIIIKNRKLFDTISKANFLKLEHSTTFNESLKKSYEDIDPLLNNLFLIDDKSNTVVSFGKNFAQAEKTIYSIVKSLLVT